MEGLINKLRRICRTSITKTLFFNFKMLPIKQAIKLPILLTRNIHFYSLLGKITIEGKVSFGCVRFGYFGEDYICARKNYSIIAIDGDLILSPKNRFGSGIVLNIRKGASIHIGENVAIGNLVKIICFEEINIGSNTRIAWESQILDTSFHYIRNVATHEIYPINKKIIIGNNNWIGNRATIMKGTVLPDFTIVSSYSFCNKKYDIEKYSMLGGIPAKVVKQGIYRCLDNEERQIKSKLKPDVKATTN